MIENINIEEIEGLLEALPVDISFIDANDQVKYWNKHNNRIFTRPFSVLGKAVQDCHPKETLHKVNELLADLKSGRRKSASFWINRENRRIYISYYSVRNKEGQYLGVIETTQDITDLQKLEGEKRILED
jgi:uncharacterized protein